MAVKFLVRIKENREPPLTVWGDDSDFPESIEQSGFYNAIGGDIVEEYDLYLNIPEHKKYAEEYLLVQLKHLAKEFEGLPSSENMLKTIDILEKLLLRS